MPRIGFGAYAAAAVVLLGLALPAAAQMKSEVQFEAGNDNAAVEGTITGDEYRDYILGAKGGQTMSVSLITEGSAFFNILPPGSDNVAIYNGSTEGENASVELPEDGDYTIRVYLMGNDRDSGASVPYTVSVTIM
ncbi:hypothetical protein [Afifella pfennigii]|uniref:hypothetical protein n=1 Tax=Afifella pfennigii TaxID=209897 RepID=UPI00047EAC10|nr:hypothetical protein [Afifella pfennigii]